LNKAHGSQSIIITVQLSQYTCNSLERFCFHWLFDFSTFAHRAGGQSLFEAWYPAWASSGSTMLYASAKLWPSGSAPFREGLLPPLGWLVASRGGATSLASCRIPPAGHYDQACVFKPVGYHSSLNTRTERSLVCWPSHSVPCGNVALVPTLHTAAAPGSDEPLPIGFRSVSQAGNIMAQAPLYWASLTIKAATLAPKISKVTTAAWRRRSSIDHDDTR